MNKKKIKIIIILVPLIILISTLSGCIAVNAIQTKHWDHADTSGTAVKLWGYLKLPENAHNWDAYFLYDTEFHDNWEHYQFQIEADSYDSWNFFSVEIEGLDRTTEYHYRAFGEHKSQANTIRVGIDNTFIPGGPRVIVKDPSYVGVDSAVIEGELTHMGGADSCEVHFIYGTDPDNLNMESNHEIMTSTGDFNAELTSLSSCQKYYYKAVATNDADTWVSNALLYTIREFTPGMPSVQTYFPHEVTATSAKFRGQLFNLGGTSTCEVWFEYGDKNQYNLDEVTDKIIMDSLGEFNIVEEELEPETVYWVRAVANNGECEHKGAIKKFGTSGYKNLNIQPSDPIDESKNIKDGVQGSIIRSRIISLINRFYEKLESLDSVFFEKIMKKCPLLDKYLEDLGYQ